MFFSCSNKDVHRTSFLKTRPVTFFTDLARLDVKNECVWTSKRRLLNTGPMKMFFIVHGTDRISMDDQGPKGVIFSSFYDRGSTEASWKHVGN